MCVVYHVENIFHSVAFDTEQCLLTIIVMCHFYTTALIHGRRKNYNFHFQQIQAASLHRTSRSVFPDPHCTHEASPGHDASSEGGGDDGSHDRGGDQGRREACVSRGKILRGKIFNGDIARHSALEASLAYPHTRCSTDGASSGSALPKPAAQPILPSPSTVLADAKSGPPV